MSERWAVLQSPTKPRRGASAEARDRAGRAFWLSVVAVDKVPAKPEPGVSVLTRAEAYKHAWTIIELVKAIAGRRIAALADRSAGAARVWVRVIADAKVAVVAVSPGGSAGVKAASARIYQTYQQKVGRTFKATAAVGPVEVAPAFIQGLLGWALAKNAAVAE